MLKKIMLLGATLAALVALAAPAAQAEVSWQTNGVPIVANDVVTFEGNVNAELTSKAAGAHAKVVATVELKAGTLEVGQSVGNVVGFHVSNCTGTGALNGLPCTPVNTPTNPGWDVTLIGESELSMAVNMHFVFYLSAAHTTPVSTTTLVGPVTVEGEPEGITQGTLTPGVGLVANGSAATVSGTLGFVGENVLSAG